MNSGEAKPVRVLVVEDARGNTDSLAALLNSDPHLQVVGTVRDGRDVLETVERERPQVIAMDIHVPHLNGFETTRRIMEKWPTPIVIISGNSSPDNVATNFQALDAGALAVVARPADGAAGTGDLSARELVETVKLMSEVKVVRRRFRPRLVPPIVETPLPRARLRAPLQPIVVAAIGASTGGPLALQIILSALPRNFPVPVLIVQHMTPGFTQGFVEWLGYSSSFPVRVAIAGELVVPGRAYVAPDHFQMGVSADHRIVLTTRSSENGMSPSVSFLFRSVAEVFGRQAVAVLLTGMGTDGVEEMKRLKDVGAVTIAQDEESSIVHGMPGEAIKAGAAVHVLPPEEIAKALTTLVTRP